MLKVIKLKINGKEQETAVDDRESLLDTLRRRLPTEKRVSSSPSFYPSRA